MTRNRVRVRTMSEYEVDARTLTENEGPAKEIEIPATDVELASDVDVDASEDTEECAEEDTNDEVGMGAMGEGSDLNSGSDSEDTGDLPGTRYYSLRALELSRLE
jgi:hypothetical protein